MLPQDTWYGIIEKAVAKTTLAQFEQKIESKCKKEMNKKHVKAENHKKDEGKKLLFRHCGAKQIQNSVKDNGKNNINAKKSHNPSSTFVSNKSCHETNGTIGKTKSMLGLTKNTNRQESQRLKSQEMAVNKFNNFEKRTKEEKNNMKNVSKLLMTKSLKTELNEKLANVPVVEKLSTTVLKQGPKASSKSIGQNENNHEKGPKEEKKKMCKKECVPVSLKNCQPISIILPCSDVTEKAAFWDRVTLKKNVQPKGATKAKSSIELPYRPPQATDNTSPPKNAVEPKPEPRVNIQQKVQDQSKKLEKEQPRRWRTGTNISTSAIGFRRTIPQKTYRPPRARANVIQGCIGSEAGHKTSIQQQNKLSSTLSIIQLMQRVEGALGTDKHSSKTEHLLNLFKDKLNKNLIFSENPIQAERIPKSNSSKKSNNTMGKKIRISECSDVRGFMEMLAGTREYNWKTKSVVQHRPAESPWLNILVPKEEGDIEKPQTKVIVIPEVDPMSDIVEACVEKELKRCDGFPNVKKAKCKDITKEKVLLCYEQSAIEKYSPFEGDSEINDLFLKFGLPYMINTANKLGITLSETNMNHIPKVKLQSSLSYSEPPCTPMSQKLLGIMGTKKNKRSNKIKGNRKKKKSLKRNIDTKKNYTFEELQKQIEMCQPPYIFNRDRSLNNITFEQEPQTYINLTEKSLGFHEFSGNDTSYKADYVVLKNEKTPLCDISVTSKSSNAHVVDVNDIINALEKAQDILMNIPTDILENDILQTNNNLNLNDKKSQDSTISSDGSGFSTEQSETEESSNQFEYIKLSDDQYSNTNVSNLKEKSNNLKSIMHNVKTMDVKTCKSGKEKQNMDDLLDNNTENIQKDINEKEIASGNENKDNLNKNGLSESSSVEEIQINELFENNLDVQTSETNIELRENCAHEKQTMENTLEVEREMNNVKYKSEFLENILEERLSNKPESSEEIIDTNGLKMYSCETNHNSKPIPTVQNTSNEIYEDAQDFLEKSVTQLTFVSIEESVKKENLDNIKLTEEYSLSKLDQDKIDDGIILTHSKSSSEEISLQLKVNKIIFEKVTEIEKLQGNAMNVPAILHLFWEKRIYVSPVTGRMVGYNRKKHLISRFNYRSIQVAIIYNQLDRFYEAEIMINAYLKDYYPKKTNENVDNKKGLPFIRDILKSASINTIHEVRPNNQRQTHIEEKLFHNVFYVQLIQPASTNFQANIVYNKLKPYVCPPDVKLRSICTRCMFEYSIFNKEMASTNACIERANINQTELNYCIDEISKLTSVTRSNLFSFIKMFSNDLLGRQNNWIPAISDIEEMDSDINRITYAMEKQFQKAKNTLRTMSPSNRLELWWHRHFGLKHMATHFEVNLNKKSRQFVIKLPNFDYQNLGHICKLLFIVLLLLCTLQAGFAKT